MKLVIAVIVVVFALVLLAVRVRRVSALRARQAAQTARQGAILAIMDELKQLVEDPHLAPDEIERRAPAIIDRLQAWNEDGVIDPIVDDNRLYLAERMAARRAGGGKPGN